MERPVRILFVCHGNICRSPMAEFVLRDLAERRGAGDRVAVASAATSSEELGNPVHPGTRRMLEAHGISCAGKTARRLSSDEYDDWNLIIGMDDANVRNAARMLGGDPAGKVHKLLEYAGSTSDIADPWYTGDFQATYDDVCDGCVGLLAFLGL